MTRCMIGNWSNGLTSYRPNAPSDLSMTTSLLSLSLSAPSLRFPVDRSGEPVVLGFIDSPRFSCLTPTWAGLAPGDSAVFAALEATESYTSALPPSTGTALDIDSGPLAASAAIAAAAEIKSKSCLLILSIGRDAGVMAGLLRAEVCITELEW